MSYVDTMSKVRTTLVLDEPVFDKLRQLSPDNMSKLANQILAESLFNKRKSMAGALAGLVSVKDIPEDEDEIHEDLYR